MDEYCIIALSTLNIRSRRKKATHAHAVDEYQRRDRTHAGAYTREGLVGTCALTVTPRNVERN